jgi:alpha-methylacyl-CoA racemase
MKAKNDSSLTKHSMILADYGVDVVGTDRSTKEFGPEDTLRRRKRSIVIDLKSAASKAVLLRFVPAADVLIDPFRPDLLEKLGFGP